MKKGTVLINCLYYASLVLLFRPSLIVGGGGEIPSTPCYLWSPYLRKKGSKRLNFFVCSSKSKDITLTRV